MNLKWYGIELCSFFNGFPLRLRGENERRYRCMTKVDNVVRKVTFKNDDDLYYQLDRFLLTDPELTGKNLHLKHIQMLDEHTAFVYLEEDLNTIFVRLIGKDGEELLCDEDYPFEFLTMSFEELRYVIDTGRIVYNDVAYNLKNDIYNIKDNGGRFVDLYLA